MARLFVVGRGGTERAALVGFPWWRQAHSAACTTYIYGLPVHFDVTHALRQSGNLSARPVVPMASIPAKRYTPTPAVTKGKKQIPDNALNHIALIAAHKEVTTFLLRLALRKVVDPERRGNRSRITTGFARNFERWTEILKHSSLLAWSL